MILICVSLVDLVTRFYRELVCLAVAVYCGAGLCAVRWRVDVVEGEERRERDLLCSVYCRLREASKGVACLPGSWPALLSGTYGREGQKERDRPAQKAKSRDPLKRQRSKFSSQVYTLLLLLLLLMLCYMPLLCRCSGLRGFLACLCTFSTRLFPIGMSLLPRFQG